ncbi:CarD family transcriptional regulator [Oceanobacillus salinisoli]|uniref:CarD family transcriptional regulator n=1 Tax=Oceanobacillus salinisoli TaxID=2678611 RepID=UPI0012E12D97|nr:CarD family transcriptional regulator [Oceanobacillus salinisoli]
MFDIGDLIVYSVHGVCKIDDICEKTYGDVTRTYYVLHPLEEKQLTINAPVDNDKVVILKMMDREEAEEILQSFKLHGISWIENVKLRTKQYNSIVNTGNRKEISKIANTLMRKDQEAKQSKKRLYDQDRRLLSTIQEILFKELAMSLETTYEDIYEKVNNMIIQSN